MLLANDCGFVWVLSLRHVGKQDGGVEKKRRNPDVEKKSEPDVRENNDPVAQLSIQLQSWLLCFDEFSKLEGFSTTQTPDFVFSRFSSDTDSQ